MKVTFLIPPFRWGTLAVVGAESLMSGLVQAQPDPTWLAHDRTRPLPAVVTPGSASTPDKAGTPPSDAVVLFGGSDLNAWCAMDGNPTKWMAENGVMKCVPGSGYVRTKQCFGDCQLHVEFAAPTPAQGEGQGRGNSGVFLGLDRYEIQVLDSYNNKTYADGSAGSVYCQYPPLVNASRPSGEWQSYDIIWTAPRFEADGKLKSPAYLTVLHNGVLVQNHVELTGPTGWLTRAPYRAHPEKLPLSLQDHGNPVRYRNIWVRELGKPSKREFALRASLLETYVGTYEINPNSLAMVATDPAGQLSIEFLGARFTLFAESPTRFFANTTDVQVEFQFSENEKVAVISVGEGGMRAKKIR